MGVVFYYYYYRIVVIIKCLYNVKGSAQSKYHWVSIMQSSPYLLDVYSAQVLQPISVLSIKEAPLGLKLDRLALEDDHRFIQYAIEEPYVAEPSNNTAKHPESDPHWLPNEVPT